MKFAILIASIALSFSAFSAVVSDYDKENNCTLYRVTTETTPATLNETIENDLDVYGLSIINMEVNFQKKSVSVDPMMNIFLGMNRRLINSKVTISNKNPNFNFLINQLNRKLYVFEKMCITGKNELVYANMFETKPEAK